MSNRIFNQFDADVIRRMNLGLRHKDIPAKRMAAKRKVATYRAARRNEVLHGDVPSTWKGAEGNNAENSSDTKAGARPRNSTRDV
jgi:hypothetical protein